MKVYLLFTILFFTSLLFGQESNTGIVSDNFISSNIVTFNPASIVDSKTKIAFVSNYNLSKISNFYAQNYILYGIGGKYINSNKSGYENKYSTVDLLNFKYEFNHKNAIGYAFREKSFSSINGLPSIWSENAVNNYSHNITNKQQNISSLAMNNLSYTEHIFSFAHLLFDKEKHFLKAGVSLKFLNGLDAKYFNVKSGEISFNTISPNMVVSNLEANFGQSASNNQLFYKNKGMGLDLGFIYEYRPNYEMQYYEMDGEKKNVRYDINKYKVKISGSITDIGRINFMKDTLYANFYNSNATVYSENIYNPNSIFVSPYKGIFDQLQVSGKKTVSQNSNFKMYLPTTLHLSVDYHFKSHFYFSYNVSMPLSLSSNKIKITNFFIQTITPRIENSKYSLMLPISHMGNGKLYVGLAGRLSYKKVLLFLGSNNLSILIGQKTSLSRNFFCGVAFNILYKTHSDVDFDKISDDKDVCPFDAGLAEFEGCPDSDGDQIIDKLDNCIYDKGPHSTNGCPDKDGDGIIDMNDMCPNEKGLGIHYGCPDRDFDGVIDAADRCPDVPGIELNNGCPFENPGCCMDDDGDGVSNRVDRCPDYAGSVYNNGCPIDSLNINLMNLRDQKNLIDANNTNSQIENQKVDDTRVGLITTKEEYTKLIGDHDPIGEHTVFFDYDQSNISEEERLSLEAFFNILRTEGNVTIVVIGYTDKDGTFDYNLILSKKRAETIKRKLIDAGFPANKIMIYYYGETKLIHRGTYSKEMKKEDRKVEIKIFRKEEF
ncbi:MAG: OmpA family protein [Flavobacteriia bacterium]|nr:OmpA family protein [Flavobacteriia bacterium]